MRKIFSLLTVILIISIGLTACSGSDTKPASNGVSKKVIKVGTSGQYRPYSFMDNDGKLVGFEIDTVNEVARRAGFEVEWNTIGFSGLFGALDSKQIDTIANQITITDERKAKYSFANPYTYDGAQIFVKTGNNSLTKFEDFKGKKLGVDLGSNYESLVRDLDKNNEIQVITYKSAATGGLTDTELGRIDGYVMDKISTMVNIQDMGLKLQPAGAPIASIENAFPFLNDDNGKDLKEKFNKALDDMRKDGTLNEISNKWFKLNIIDK